MKRSGDQDFHSVMLFPHHVMIVKLTLFEPHFHICMVKRWNFVVSTILRPVL